MGYKEKQQYLYYITYYYIGQVDRFMLKVKMYINLLMFLSLKLYVVKQLEYGYSSKFML